jgi:glycosyltransferase involved in cell wall biosynthesis
MLIIYRYRVPFPNDKAHSIQIAHTIHALARAGAEVWFYPGEYTQPPEQALAFYGLTPHRNLHLRLHPQWTRRSRQWKGALIRMWERRRFGGAADRKPVFYLRDGEDSFEYAQKIALVKRRWNARIIIEPHRVHKMELDEYSRPDAPEHERKQLGNRLKKLAEQEGPALHAADALAPISQTLAESLRETYSDLPPMQVVPSGAMPAESEDVPLSRRKGVIYAGQLYAWKGVHNLIAAMAHLPGETLTLVGGNKETDLEEAREVARKHGVLQRLIFTGHVPHHEVQRHVRQARCSVVPLGTDLLARRFTSPIKVFEYMAAGTPIVASDLPTIREVLRDEVSALLAPPGDALGLAARIKRLLTDDQLADRVRTRALADLGRYTWGVRARSIIEFAGEGSAH